MPMSVSTYRVDEKIPEEIRKSIPTVKQLEQELSSIDEKKV